MATGQESLLPLHRLLEALESWRVAPTSENHAALGAAVEALMRAYAADGAYLRISGSPLPDLELGAGSLEKAMPDQLARIAEYDLTPAGVEHGSVSAWLSGQAPAVGALSGALSLAVGAIWSRREAEQQRQQLQALDAAVRGIADVLAVDRVLQLIVDRVRDLVGAQYAALGIAGPFGHIEQFITSGVTDEQRARIGHLPRGHGLLGLIIREDASFLIDDIATDPRRHGFPNEHPEMHSFLGVPVRNKGRSIGNLYLTNKLVQATFSEADLRLVEMFALHAGIAIENARLHEEIGRLVIVEERQRISQDLHDSVIQSLYAISLSLEDLPEVISEDAGEGALRADRAIDSIHATIRDIRNFIMGLQPELLADADLTSGIETLAAEFRANTLIDLELGLADDLPELAHDQAAHVLAITREALSNIARHSSATRASIALSADNGTLDLIIGDNGRGFDAGQPRGARQRGLGNLRARAEGIGGQLKIASEPGAGTRLEAHLPLGGAAVK